jgi:hypothetical protein
MREDPLSSLPPANPARGRAAQTARGCTRAGQTRRWVRSLIDKIKARQRTEQRLPKPGNVSL